MATILKGARLYVGEHDMSGDANEVSLNYKAKVVDITTIGSSAREKLSGLTDWSLSSKGILNTDEDGVDERLFAKIGLGGQPCSLFPTGAGAGAMGYLGQVLAGEYAPGGQVGELLLFTVSAEGTDVLVRGYALASGAQTASGSGTAVNAGAVAANQQLYAVLHVLAISGTDSPTLSVTLQSDAAQAFSSPEDQLTFADATDVGAQWATPVAGPIADTWWRAAWTITGTNPSFTFAVAMGIR